MNRGLLRLFLCSTAAVILTLAPSGCGKKADPRPPTESFAGMKIDFSVFPSETAVQKEK